MLYDLVWESTVLTFIPGQEKWYSISNNKKLIQIVFSTDETPLIIGSLARSTVHLRTYTVQIGDLYFPV